MHNGTPLRKIKEVEKQYVPPRTPCRKKGTKPLDQETVKLIKHKHRAWTRYLETRDASKYQEYTRLRNKVRNRTRNITKKHQEEIAKEIKTNPKKFWSYVNRNTKYKPVIPDIKTDEGIAKSDAEKAESLGKFFSSVFVHEDDSRIPHMERVKPDCHIETVSIDEELVKKRLLDLKIDKSPGPDEIYPRILKETAKELAYPVSEVFKTSLVNGVLPEIWKIGNITAIHKKGPKNLCNNYRPVSLTSILCKVLEGIIRDEIMSYMTKNKMLSKRQYEFLPKRSTTQQLLKIMDEWTECLDQGRPIEAV